MDNEKFHAMVCQLVSAHGINARVFHAIACDACYCDEQYGVVVELTYTASAQLVDVARVFKLAFQQERVQLIAKGYVHSVGTKISKVAMCTLPAGSRLMHSALSLHNEQRVCLKQFGITTSVILYDDKKAINLLSVRNPQENPRFGYWQKCLEGFLKRQGLTPVFDFVRVFDY